MAPPAPQPVHDSRREYAHQVSFRLPAATASVGAARAYTAELLDAWDVAGEVAEDAVLVVSELVTNAVAHTASEQVVCRLRSGERRLYVEVEDEARGCTFPVRRTPAPASPRGRGLLLVEALSLAWGVMDAPQGCGRIVWAELPSPAPWYGPARPATERP